MDGYGSICYAKHSGRLTALLGANVGGGRESDMNEARADGGNLKNQFPELEAVARVKFHIPMPESVLAVAFGAQTAQTGPLIHVDRAHLSEPNWWR